MQDYQDGQTRPGPGGTYTRQGGQWVLSSPALMSSRPPGPTGPQAVARNDAETRAAVANAAAAELRLAHERQAHADEVAARSPPPGDLNLRGTDYLTQARRLNPQAANMAQALLEGRVPYPTGAAMRQPLMMQAVAMAQQADPQYDANISAQRHQALLNFTGNNAHGSALFRSAETLAGHLQQLSDVSARLSGPDLGIGPLSSLAAGALQSRQQADLRAYNTLAGFIANEAIRFTTNGNGGEGDRQAVLANLRPDQSTAARTAAIQAIVGAVHSGLDAYRNEYARAFPEGVARPHIDWLSPAATSAFQNLDPDGRDWSAPGPGGPSGPVPGSAPPPGGTPPGSAPGGERMDATSLTAGPNAGPGAMLSPNSVADPARAAVNAQASRDVAGMMRAHMSDAAIRAAMPPGFNAEADLAWRRSNPASFNAWARSGADLPVSDQNPNAPLSGLARGVADLAASAPGTMLTHAANGFAPLSLWGNGNDVNTALEAQSQANPGSALIGQLAGTAGAYTLGGSAAGAGGRALLRGAGGAAAGEGSTLAGRVGNFLVGGSEAAPLSTPANAVRSAVGDAAYGAVQGQGDGDPLSGAAASVAGGMFGRGAGRTLGVAARGVADPAVQYLTNRGVPLTLGQILGQTGRVGQAIRSTEGAFSGINPLIEGQYRNGIRGLNTAAFDDAVKPFGGTSPGAIGERGLENIRVQRSAAYGNALDGQQFNVDPQFTTDLSAARAQGSAIPGDLGRGFSHVMDTRVDPMIIDGAVSGKNYQAALQGVRRARSSFASQPLGDDFGQGTRSVENAFNDLVQRQAPEVVPALDRANAMNRRVSILGDAVNKGQANVEQGDHMFTPYQLNAASVANTKKYGGAEAATSTQRPFYDLTTHGQQVLPNTVPNNGARSLYGMSALGLLGGVGAASDASGATDHGQGTGAALTLGALATLPYTGAGRRALQAILVKRPDLLRSFGENVLSQQVPIVPNVGPQITIPRAWGMFGSGAAAYGGAQQGGTGY